MPYSYQVMSVAIMWVCYETIVLQNYVYINNTDILPQVQNLLENFTIKDTYIHD